MKPLSLLLGIAMLSQAVSAAESRAYLKDIERQDAIATKVGADEALSAMHPAFELVEGVSDGLFDFVRYDVLDPVFHGIKDHTKDYRDSDSYDHFEQAFTRKENRFLLRLSDTFHRPDGATVNPGLPAADESRDWAKSEQLSILLDAWKDTMLDRYQVKELGRWAQGYARNPENWDPASLTFASMIGGAFLYLNGAHDQLNVGPLKIAMDLRGAIKLREAMKQGGSLGRAAGIEAGIPGKPLTFFTDWGVDSGKIHRESFGLKFHKKF